MNEHSQKTNEKDDDVDNNNNSNDSSGIKNNSSNSFLFKIIEPVFGNPKSHTQLSHFLTLPFVLSTKTVPLIHQSMKGYLQLAHPQKPEQILELLPLEKFDEYYFPQEIEEEIILSSDSAGPVRKKVSLSSSSYSPHPAQKSEKVSEVSSGASSVASVPSKLNPHHQQQQQQQPMGLGKNKKPSQFIIEAEEAPSEKRALPSSSKTKAFLKEEVVRTNNLKSSSKAHSDIIASSSEAPQPIPTKTSVDAKTSSKTGDSEYNISSMRVSEPTTASPSTEPNKSKVVADDLNRNLQSKQFVAGSSKSNAKIPIRRDRNDNFKLASSEVHDRDDNSSNNPDDKPIQTDIITQTKKIARLAGKSPNLSDITQSVQDRSFELVSSKRDNTVNNTSFDSIMPPPPQTKIEDNQDSINKPYGISKPQIRDTNQKPTITINNLEVHVIGKNNNSIQRSMVSPSIESEESHRVRGLDLGDYQVNTETLNKSYLWKYKVRRL